MRHRIALLVLFVALAAWLVPDGTQLKPNVVHQLEPTRPSTRPGHWPERPADSVASTARRDGRLLLTGVVVDGRTAVDVPFELELHELDALFNPSGQSSRFTTDAHGHFHTEVPREGLYRLRGAALGSGFVIPLTLNISGDLYVTARIVRSGFVSGVVEGASGEVNVVATRAFPETDRLPGVVDRAIHAVTAPTGAFSLELPVGAWHLRAVRGDQVSAGDEVTIRAGATIERRLRLLRSTLRVSGFVHDDGGHPIEGARLLVTLAERVELDALMTDSRGHFEFDLAARDTWSMVAEAPGFLAWRSRTFSSDSRVMDIELQRAGSIEGTVKDAHGALVEAWVRAIPETTGAPATRTRGGHFALAARAPGATQVLAGLTDGHQVLADAEVEVIAGQTVRAELVLPSVERLELYTRWKCPAEPPHPLSIGIWGGPLRFASIVSLASEGVTTVRFPEGHFRLRGDVGRCWVGAAEFEVKGTVTRLELEILPRPVATTLQLVDSHGLPVPGAQVSVRRGDSSGLGTLTTWSDAEGMVSLADELAPRDEQATIEAFAGHAFARIRTPQVPALTMTLRAPGRLRVSLGDDASPEECEYTVEAVDSAFREIFSGRCSEVEFEVRPETLRVTASNGEQWWEGLTTIEPGSHTTLTLRSAE